MYNDKRKIDLSISNIGSLNTEMGRELNFINKYILWFVFMQIDVFVFVMRFSIICYAYFAVGRNFRFDRINLYKPQLRACEKQHYRLTSS